MFWIRQVEVLAGQKKFESYGDNALTIEFNINFNDSEDPDLSEIKIYNLSNETIEDIKRDGYLYLNAGYRDMGNMSNILTGEIEDVNTEWQGLDKIITIKVGDGSKKWRKATLNKTYKNNTKASLIMNDLCNVLGYEIVAIEPKKDINYPLGKTIKGSCSETLKQLAKDTKSKMFINKNRIVIREEKKGYDTGFVLNSNTGLISSPTLDKDDSGDKDDTVDSDKNKKKNKEVKKSWTVKCLLNPKLETDNIIKIQSKSLNGVFRIVSGKHSCNSSAFITELKVEEI